MRANSISQTKKKGEDHGRVKAQTLFPACTAGSEPHANQSRHPARLSLCILTFHLCRVETELDYKVPMEQFDETNQSFHQMGF